MARVPTKLVRFLVWCSASSENRADAVNAFLELFEEVYDEFGPAYAHVWSVGQALKSLPYGFGSMGLKLITLFLKFGS